MGKDQKSALEFHYDQLYAPPIGALFTPDDINELIRIATSLRYNGNISKKYELIDKVMRFRGFIKAHCGTNRVVYNFLEDPRFIVKVALDKVGMTDSPREFINQQFFQPFCCKIFEVHPSGVIATVERVNPISSLEEFMSIADDVFNLMVVKIIGKYVVDDLGTKTYMNFGVRYNANGCAFGPVIIDFPYVYELDGAKLICHHLLPNGEICMGEIDYKPGFNGLYCTKCKREYKAMDLAKNQASVELVWDKWDSSSVKHLVHKFRARVIDNSKILLDSGRSSDLYIPKEDFEIMSMFNENIPDRVPVARSIYNKRVPKQELRMQSYSELRDQIAKAQMAANAPKIGDLLDDSRQTVRVVKKIIEPPFQERSRISNPIYGLEDDDFYELDGTTSVKVARSVNRDGTVIKETKVVKQELVQQTQETQQQNQQMIDVKDLGAQWLQGAIDALKGASADIAKEILADQKKKQQQTIEVSSTVTVTQEPIQGDVVPNEELQEMIKEVEKHNIKQDETIGSGNDAILDPDNDKAHVNPVTRPYANGDPSVFVGNKQPKTEKAKFDGIITDPNLQVGDGNPPEEEQVPDENEDEPDSDYGEVPEEFQEEKSDDLPPLPEELVHDPASEKGRSQIKYKNKKKGRDNGGYD